MTITFAQLGVPNHISSALAERGITEPFEIQAATIADALEGRDVCGRAPTGSGKTLAFGIPLVATVDRATPKFPRALILAPTRELAEQINTELRSFSGKVRVGVVYGGVGYGPQLNLLRKGVDILVACPGRLEDLIERGDVVIARRHPGRARRSGPYGRHGIHARRSSSLDQTSNKRQTVLFSATLDGDVAKLTRDYQKNPVRHEVGEETPDITSASHVFWNSVKEDRATLTAEAVDAVWPAIIFCRTRHGSDRLAKQLARTGLKAAAIHGGRSQGQRTRALSDFSEGRVHALVATDVAARGIHVDGVALVVHYDPPEDHKAYVHRSGRTARAGEGGVVVSLIQGDQKKDMRKMQRQIDLDEPLIDADVLAMRSLSTTEERTLAPPRPGQEQTPGKRNGGRGSGRGNGRGGGGSRSGGAAVAWRQGTAEAVRRPARWSVHQTGAATPRATVVAARRATAPAGAPNRKARRSHMQKQNSR